MNTRAAINDIINSVNAGKTVIYCGAGISRNSGLPVVNELVLYILEKLGISGKAANLIPKAIPFEAFIETLKENSRLDRLFDIFELGEPNTNHILLAKLVKAGKVKIIVTTNFDKLIERAFDLEGMKEESDYDVVFREADFEKVPWSNGKAKLIKIHGSIDDREGMAITLKQVASQVLSLPRMAIIEQVFCKGLNDNVLILGYSASDVFDLSLQIQAINEPRKKIYYLQHCSPADIARIEGVEKQTEKNPFQKYTGSRLFCNTDQFIEDLWQNTIPGQPFTTATPEVTWKRNADEWYQQAMREQTEEMKDGLAAALYVQVGMFETAVERYQAALKLATEQDDKHGMELWLGGLGLTYMYLGDYSNAMSYNEQALRIAEQLHYKDKIEACLGNMGNIYVYTGEFAKAIDCYGKAVKIAEEIKDLQGMGLWFSGMATCYQTAGDYSKATTYHNKSIDIARETGDKQSEGQSTGNIGNVYAAIGNFEMATAKYEQALKIARQVGDRKSEGLWLCHMGNVAQSLGKSDQSIAYQLQALEIAQDIKDRKGEGSYLGNLGIAYNALGDHTKALEYFERALAIEKAIDDKVEMGLSLSNIGNVYNNTGEHLKAIEYYQEAMAVAESIGNIPHQGECMGGIGKAYYNLDDLSTAIGYFRAALQVARSIGDVPSKDEWLTNIGRIYVDANRHAEALEYYEEAVFDAQAFGIFHHELAWRDILSYLYSKVGDYDKAISSYKRELALARQLNDRRAEGGCLGNLGNLYSDLGDAGDREQYRKAVEYYQQAIAILTELYGAEYRHVQIFERELKRVSALIVS